MKAATKTTADRFQVPALHRGLLILELLAGHAEGLRMSEIAEKLALPANSVFRISGLLEEFGYLRRDDAGRFRLGAKLLSLGYAALGDDKLLGQALDVMQRLRDTTTETVMIGTRLDLEGLVLEQVSAAHPLRFVVDPGTRFPLHSAAPGKAIVAHLPEAERERVLARLKFTVFNERTIAKRADFEAELGRVREQGYSVDFGEQIEGVYCLGAPIFNHRGYPTAALWLTAPSNRLPKARFKEVGPLVAAAAREVSARLGHFPAIAS